MNIFNREMRANRKSLIIWCVGILFIVGSGMAKYAALSNTGDSINKLMADMPSSLQALMGIGSLDLATVDGYFGLLYLYLVIMASIHAAMLGATMISKEERDKTAEFLFVKPISRTTVITAKLGASIVIVIVFNLVTLLSSIVFVDFFNTGDSVTAEVALLMGGMFMMQLLFLFLSAAVAAFVKNPKLSIPISTGILLSTFIMSVGIDLKSNLEGLKYVTPFKYYEAKNLLHDGGFDEGFVVLSLLLMVGSILTTYIFYRKRDLHI
ncbi:ABC transporter permease subunit [Sporosarcina sp. BP05]|uniref:ABC transporter permease subunit n=1 Tax=Sporosarcina sp. BP05 TaxID=2758726 RepID=UPI001647CF29|nr:ABC transporter permease subunit [Sporosarcina sp. BP05]